MSELTDKMLLTPDLNAERLSKLKELFPDLFTLEGKLNPDELAKIVDPESVKETERFDFKWFGKNEAKRNAFTPGRGTLVYDNERSVNPENASGNMIIEGENLESLKVLLASYREKIKMIYIDPPYNTGKDFVYSDKWNEDKEDYWEHIGVTRNGVKVDTNSESDGRYHSNWLSMMYSRLLVARELLRDDGVIFISIDDNEVHHLRKLCDEVFGEENFVAQLIWERAFSPKNDAKYISNSHDFILIYAKYITDFTIGRLDRTEEANARYTNPDNDPRGIWMSSDISVKTYNQENDYPITTPSGRMVEPPAGRCWSLSKKAFLERLKDNRIWFGPDGNGTPRLKRFLTELKYEGMVPSSLLFYKDVGHSQEGAQEVTKILESGAFDGPKPVRLLKHLLTLANLEEDSIILDFFAGSGTTAHAVIELNKEDGGNRKFILVQIPELTDEKSEAYKAGYKKISDITIERNKRVIERITKEVGEKQSELFDAGTPKVPGFKVYKLARSHFPRTEFIPDPAKSEAENLELLNAYIRDKEAIHSTLFNESDIMDELLLKNGFMLSYHKEEMSDFTANKVYRIEDEYKKCLICIDAGVVKDKKIEDATFKMLEKYKDTLFICLESGLTTTMKWNLKHLLGDKLNAV